MKFNLKPQAKISRPALTASLRVLEGATNNAMELIGNKSPNTYRAPQKLPKTTNKVDRLVAHDFPFDASQVAAINGIINQQYACLTGAAGTGKTTVTKAVVDGLLQDVGTVELKSYFKKLKDLNPEDTKDDNDDDYVIPENELYVPSICAVSYTGRASQQIKKNFPDNWHPNIMTIHRMLAYVPDWYEETDENGKTKNKMRFIPTYTEFNKMPWDVILIDEAGMLSIDLWNNIQLAMKPGCRIIMVGDINQLPPVHGLSIFGFALNDWPAWELTTIHRQTGVNNSIVDNAWNVLKGKKPESDLYLDDTNKRIGLSLETPELMAKSLTRLVINKDWKTALIRLPESEHAAHNRISSSVKALAKVGFYQPLRDTIITATNGKPGSNGEKLGSIPMNQNLSITLNPADDRYMIDAGRERRVFAVGDKVMATKNDHDIGITNGMTGVITSITRNGNYKGDWNFFDELKASQAYVASGEYQVEDDDFELSAEDIDEYLSKKDNSEDRAAGAASHIVVVDFGIPNETTKLVTFESQGGVGSIMHAYTVTCHKMQGGESPIVFIICHSLHSMMYYREWLYTAITRASQKVIIFYTSMGIKNSINKQKIKGNTLAEKALQFRRWQKVKANVKLPTKKVFGDGTRSYRQDNTDMAVVPYIEDEEEAGQVGEIIRNKSVEDTPDDTPLVDEAVTIHVRINVVAATERKESTKQEIIDGEYSEVASPIAIDARPSIGIPQVGAAIQLMHLRDLQEQKLLTYSPPKAAGPTIKFKRPTKFTIAK